ncbi:hypothetical protein EST38_g9644 [Candolleomyces aberdarensis]|uniref:Uncharacterized protein n=1 Tax=Candolleomyces aberdarensis TaxID=2316362 RepID=A0A4Q2DB42_9AGAR|nr:hypothetical protein EST38_g9644 [Candolleomyces aberdarensis]
MQALLRSIVHRRRLPTSFGERDILISRMIVSFPRLATIIFEGTLTERFALSRRYVLLFMCFNVEDPHGPTVGFINGQLPISGNLAQRALFDPVVDQVLQLLREELPQFDQPIHALLSVGGLAGSEHSKQCIGVNLPAEQEDWLKTPAYIKNSTAGVVECARIEPYIGGSDSQETGDSFAIRSRSSQSPSDPSAVPTLYAGKTDKILRCTDEDEIL